MTSHSRSPVLLKYSVLPRMISTFACDIARQYLPPAGAGKILLFAQSSQRPGR